MLIGHGYLVSGVLLFVSFILYHVPYENMYRLANTITIPSGKRKRVLYIFNKMLTTLY